MSLKPETFCDGVRHKNPDYFDDKRLKKADAALESLLIRIEMENALLSGFDEAEERSIG